MGLVAMRVCLVGAVLALTVLTDANVASESSPTCDKLQKIFAPGKRYLSVDDQVRNISLYWGSDPAHAASALLTVILRHAHGYQHVRMMKGEHDLTKFAKKIDHNIYGVYEDSILALSTAWDPATEPPKTFKVGYTTGLGGPRLQEIALSRVPATVRLHVYLPLIHQEKEDCKYFAHWVFYTNRSALENCGFIHKRDDKGAVVYFISDASHKASEVADTLKSSAKGVLLQFMKNELDRQTHFQILNNANESFLFLDYDMWKDEHNNVHTVQEPFCLPNDLHLDCLPGLDNAIGMRVAEPIFFGDYASQLFQLAHTFIPSNESLKFILKQNATGTGIEEAACRWVSENIDTVKKKWVEDYEPKRKTYEIAVFYSRGPDAERYGNLTYNASLEIFNQFQSSFQLILACYPHDYFELNTIKSEINNYMRLNARQQLIGAVVGGDNKTTEIVRTFDEMGLPVLSYDVASEDTDSTKSVWLTTGRLAHLALAVKDFIRRNEWRRVAVLSDSTHTAKLFLEDINNASDAVRDHPVKHNLSNTDAEMILNQLKKKEVFIFVVNAHNQETSTILTAAVKLEMNGLKYVWIVREWDQYDNISLNVNFFTFSFGCQSGNDAPIISHNGSRKLLDVMDELWPNNNWPRSAVALLDALWIMAKGFQHVLDKYPEARDDPHSARGIKEFGKSLIDLSPIEGFTQNLTFKGHSIEKAVIYLNKWHDGNRTLLSRWSVNAKSGAVILEHKYQDVYNSSTPKPSDGTPVNCLARPKDPFLADCYDAIWISIVVFILFLSVVAMLIYNAVRRHLKDLQKKLITDLLAQRMERAATLSSYLVDRSALKSREELGAGRFGCVRLADLRVPGCKARVVAAKELRDHQDESEIMREACILASLKHDNIIRLVGVCIDNEPTLVLMEVAFFGDLLQYLKDRRHIAESVVFDEKAEVEQVCEEAAHVSAKSLTRLAREAASALAYLAVCGVIHRDLRASNCLVDERRSLKLADFGLARETKAIGLDGGGEYECRRRGLFPVLWMAPESLMSGVFSTASDVYSLGMLIFELVTLGARPYGKASPLRVMQYVTSGGMPQMPAGTTPQATGLAHLCWQRLPEKRPTAAELVAYLADNPRALSPAPNYEKNQPTDADSGYGESPSTEKLIPG